MKIGDIFEISTKNGLAYAQYVFEHKTLGEFIKVYYKLHGSRPIGFNFLDEDNYYYINHAVKEEIKDGVFKYVTNNKIPSDFKLPKYFRTENLFGEGWHIVNSETWFRESVLELNEEQTKLSPWGLFSKGELVKKLEEEWRLEDWIECDKN